MANETDRILVAADLAGTLVFAVEGALAGGGDLDLLGLLVLAFATAPGGGIIRDLLIGDVPPAALKLALPRSSLSWWGYLFLPRRAC